MIFTITVSNRETLELLVSSVPGLSIEQVDKWVEDTGTNPMDWKLKPFSSIDKLSKTFTYEEVKASSKLRKIFGPNINKNYYFTTHEFIKQFMYWKLENNLISYEMDEEKFWNHIWSL